MASLGTITVAKLLAGIAAISTANTYLAYPRDYKYCQTHGDDFSLATKPGYGVSGVRTNFQNGISAWNGMPEDIQGGKKQCTCPGCH